MSELPEIFGGYTLLKEIGRGGGGEVFLARPNDPGRGLPERVVLKRLLVELHEEPEVVERFRHEATLASLIESPYLARVYEAGQVDGRHYFVQQLIEGESLQSVMQRWRAGKRRPELSLVVEMIAGALLGLQALHSAKDASGRPLSIVHRDIAPKNIMIGEKATSTLIDLGIGRSNVQDFETRTGIVLGSPGYMAPEQVLGRALDHRADLYSAAVIVWEMLTGRRYVEGETFQEKVRGSIAPKYRAVRAVRPDLPEQLDELLRRALAHDPAVRFESASELLQALESAVLNERTQPAASPGAARGPSRATLWQAFGALVIASIALVAIIQLGRSREPVSPIEIAVESERAAVAPVARASSAADAGTASDAAVNDAAVNDAGSTRAVTTSRRAGDAGAKEESAAEPAAEVAMESYVDDLIQRAVSLTQRYPDGAPPAVLQVLNDLNLLRVSPRLFREREAARALEQKLAKLEAAAR